MRILIVDDDADALQAVCRALERGHEILPCGGGEQAIAALREHSIDLVLTDLSMPPPDGFDVMRAVRGLPAPPPVVVVTGLDRARAAIDALRLGAADFLVKPAATEEILAVVSRADAERRGGEAG